MKTITRMTIVTLLTTALAACMFHGGEQKHESAVTTGQKLVDLKLALDTGAITDEEYRMMRERIINTCNSERC